MAKRNGGIIGPSNVPTGQYGGTASGVWRLRDAFNYIKAGLWPGFATYPVGNSLRFNSGSSDNLSRTTGSTGNRKTVTFSGWFKRSSISGNQMIFSWGGGGLDVVNFFFNGSPETLNFYNYPGSLGANFTTNQLFRDVGAWYHIVLAVDTTQATSSNRIKLYVNGSQVTSFSSITYPTLNEDFEWNVSGESIRIGANYSVGDFINGYLAETYIIDGQQLTPSSFGQTDSATGIWTPLPFTGSFGTNGFFLKFANSAALGTDSSGNANTFTANNLTSIDQTTDTPTNNFATWNPLYAYGNQTLTEGNLRLATGTSGASVGTIAVNTGKWFWEQKCISIEADGRIAGISKLVANESLYNTSIYYTQNGDKKINNTSTAYGATLANGDIVGIAIDVDARSITFYKNGSSQGAIDISTVYSSGDYIIPALPQSGATTQTVDINFGNPPFTIASGNADANGFGNFEYAVPSGYYALNTKNLATYG